MQQHVPHGARIAKRWFPHDRVEEMSTWIEPFLLARESRSTYNWILLSYLCRKFRRTMGAMMRSIWLLVGWFLVPATMRAVDLEGPAIQYSRSQADNRVSRLAKRLEGGEVAMTREPRWGFLRAVLRELEVPQSSQVLVFSKTSLQRDRISPRTPRAIYFNDEVYVGFCQNGDLLEVAAADRSLGTVFYTVDQNAAQARFTRQADTCLLCHASSHNQGIPGHVIRSVYPDETGEPIFSAGSQRIDQSSPLSERWGGWYVSGRTSGQVHLGNQTFTGRPHGKERASAEAIPCNDLSRYFRTANYLTPHSDVVALMVLEHQAQGHNLIARAIVETRQALYDNAELNRALGNSHNELWESTQSRIRSVGEPLVRYLLFSGEAELRGELQGTSEFAQEFARRGPVDRHGRSLRQFDLTTRLFKYPCSYLIYTEAFRSMPTPVKHYVYRRLHDVLTGQDRTEAFAHLSNRDRRAIREILLDTLPDLPDEWRK
jgi:hypothetical protein